MNVTFTGDPTLKTVKVKVTDAGFPISCIQISCLESLGTIFQQVDTHTEDFLCRNSLGGNVCEVPPTFYLPPCIENNFVQGMGMTALARNVTASQALDTNGEATMNYNTFNESVGHGNGFISNGETDWYAIVAFDFTFMKKVIGFIKWTADSFPFTAPSFTPLVQTVAPSPTKKKPIK